jgi:hypothetical protein
MLLAKAVEKQGNESLTTGLWSLATDLLYFNQDGIKRSRVAHVGKFF